MVRIIANGENVSIVTPEKAVSPMMRYFNSPQGFRIKKKKARALTREEIRREDEVVRQPEPVPEECSSEVFDAVSSALAGAGMMKPVYADCWTVGRREDLRIIESYTMPLGDVVIGIADDGEIEYNLTPRDYGYGRELTGALGTAIEQVRSGYRKKGGNMDRQSVIMSARESLYRMCPDCDNVSWTMDDLCESVHRYTLGLGIFDILLCDERIEDIYIDAPCDRNRIHITMNRIEGFNSHIRCRTNLVAESGEIRNLISRLKKDTGLPYCESSPVLETDLGGCARVTVVGYPMSPNGDSVAIRKHSAVPWTLTRLVANETITPEQAGLLSFLVANRSTFIIAGARGAGKSSLLSAMMFEFPLSQRILTIEDTLELPSRQMRDLGYKVQNILIDDRMDGTARTRSEDALRVSLRMGESAIILGEVRGEEVSALYQSMRTGKAGSTIMGTMHGESARSIYDRVVHDMGITPEAFQVTDYIVTMGTSRSRGSLKEARTISEIMSTASIPGGFVDMQGPDFMDSPALQRIASSSSMSEDDIMDEVFIRAQMRRILVDISSTHGEEFLGPKWIVFANNHLAHNLDMGVRDRNAILGGFRAAVLSAAGTE